MRPITSWIRSSLALLLLAALASPSGVSAGEAPPISPPIAPPETGNNAYCYSQKTTEGTVYSSPLVQTMATAQALQDAFASYLAKEYGYAPKYGYSGYLTCITGIPDAKAESIRKGHLDNIRALADKMVETNWTYP